MFDTPYDTTACKGLALDKVRMEVLKAKIGGQLLDRELLEKSPLTFTKAQQARLLFVGPDTALIPPFAHPLVTTDDGTGTTVFTDVRSVVRKGRDGKVNITNHSEFNFLISKAYLSWVWQEGRRKDLITDFALKVFSHWVADALVNRFMLDPGVWTRCAMIAGSYFLDLHGYDRDVHRRALVLAKTSYLPAAQIVDQINGLRAMGSIAELCDTLRDHAGSVKLADLNPALLVSLVGGVWYGFAARETAVIALEYPPIFNAMLMMAVKERGFKKTPFTKLAEKYDNKGNAEQFVKRLTSLSV